MRASRPALAARRDPLGQSEHSKALAIFPRTLEIFDMAGLVGRSSRRPTASRPSRSWRTGAARSHAVRARGEPVSVHRHGAPERDRADCSLEQLRRKGGDVEYNTAFISAAQHEDSVSVTLDRTAERSSSRAGSSSGAMARTARCGIS